MMISRQLPPAVILNTIMFSIIGWQMNIMCQTFSERSWRRQYGNYKEWIYFFLLIMLDRRVSEKQDIIPRFFFIL